MSNTGRLNNPAIDHMSNTGRDVKPGRVLKKGISNSITTSAKIGCDRVNQDILNSENDSINSKILYHHQSTNNFMKNEKNSKIHNFLLETWRPTTSFYFKEKRGGGVNEVENKVVGDVIAKKGIMNAKKGYKIIQFILVLLFRKELFLLIPYFTCLMS